MGSRLFAAATILLLAGPACTPVGDAKADPTKPPNPLKPKVIETNPGPESSLGIKDRGVFPDLDSRIQLPAPHRDPALSAVISVPHQLLVVYVGEIPIKAYPLGGSSKLQFGATTLELRPGDRAELAPLLASSRRRVLPRGDSMPGGDRDGDGIPNILDLSIGAQKTAVNGAKYGAGYIRIPYPGGDVPRDVGVCTDVVIRAARNAGLDLQHELYIDIGKSPRSYPMVKKRNRHIDHRRVRTLLPYFRRHWDQRTKALADTSDPLRPGDIVFMDTMSWKRGPDHIGIVSHRKGPSGHPLVINNWTDGFETSEMDLLPSIPVTHRFRFPSAR